MRAKHSVWAILGVGMLLFCAAVPAWADRGIKQNPGGYQGSNPGGSNPGGYQGSNPGSNQGNYKGSGYVLDKRYQHNQYYPPKGHVVDALPLKHHVVPHGGGHYYYHGGVWYRPYGPRYIVGYPPYGLVVPILPPYYTTLWVGSYPYYYADNVYYTWYPEQRGYVVTEPPRETEVKLQPAQPYQLFMYPKKGQNEQLQATDRYQCHRWSAGQTGFDPSQPDGNVPEPQHAAKRSDYQRAMKACLEARGYSVQ